MTTITVHSFKGGTGKSLITVALGHHFSQKGEKVLLIDGDYNAPCFETYFPKRENSKPFTAFLEGGSKLSDTITETQFSNLWVSYAPTPSFSQEILQADVHTHGRYLKKILEGLKIAHEELEFDRVIIDNSSGISLQAMNYLTCSNKSVIVIRPVRYGVESTYEQVQAIYGKLKYVDGKSIRRDVIVWNQVPFTDGAKLDARISKYIYVWNLKFHTAGITYGATIPYIVDVISAMIADTTLDLESIAGFIDSYIEKVAEKLI